MRISDWSSDVCTSDLRCIANASERPVEQEDDQHETGRNHQHQPLAGRLEILELTTPIEIMAGRKAHLDRKSVVLGKSVSVRVDLGGRRVIKKKTKTHELREQDIRKNKEEYKKH